MNLGTSYSLSLLIKFIDDPLGTQLCELLPNQACLSTPRRLRLKARSSRWKWLLRGCSRSWGNISISSWPGWRSWSSRSGRRGTSISRSSLRKSPSLEPRSKSWRRSVSKQQVSFYKWETAHQLMGKERESTGRGHHTGGWKMLEKDRKGKRGLLLMRGTDGYGVPSAQRGYGDVVPKRLDDFPMSRTMVMPRALEWTL